MALAPGAATAAMATARHMLLALPGLAPPVLAETMRAALGLRRMGGPAPAAALQQLVAALRSAARAPGCQALAGGALPLLVLADQAHGTGLAQLQSQLGAGAPGHAAEVLKNLLEAGRPSPAARQRHALASAFTAYFDTGSLSSSLRTKLAAATPTQLQTATARLRDALYVPWVGGKGSRRASAHASRDTVVVGVP
jgi:hypothetical protein